LVFDQIFDVHLSLPMLLEYRDVLARDPDSLRLTPAEVDEFLSRLEQIAHQHDIHFLWRPILPDSGDDAVLEAAVAGRARYIVTFNVKHFHGCNKFGIEAIKPIEFMRLLKDVS
jgi:predicted nucleic acid-binding protein